MSLKDAMEKTLSSWMKKDGPHSDIVLGSRVRLARNLKEIPFPSVASKEQLRHVLDMAGHLVTTLDAIGDFKLVKMAEVDTLDRELLVEKHLISPGHAKNPTYKGLIYRSQEDINIMVNEEDHLRIQVLYPGLQLEPALEWANKVDDLFEQEVEYAFDQTSGYLTACPTNVGSGLRASVMLHLPALTKLNQLRKVLGTITQFGLVVRGLYGEGSDAIGNIYQISNQLTLGHTEQEMVEHLLRITKQVMNSERQAREYLLKPERKLAVEDQVYRAFGVLSQARVVETKEAMELLSDVRLGIDLGIIKELDAKILKQLMILIRAAHLQKVMGQNLPPEERDKLRASLIRERFKGEV